MSLVLDALKKAENQKKKNVYKPSVSKSRILLYVVLILAASAGGWHLYGSIKSRNEHISLVLKDKKPTAEFKVKENAVIFNKKAVDAYKSGNPEEAVSYLLKSIEISPENAESHNNLGVIFLSQGKLKEAVSEFDKALSIDEKFSEAANNQGLAYERLGNNKTAASYYLKALEINPEFPDANLNYAIFLDKNGGRVKESIKHYQIYLALSDKSDVENIKLVEERMKVLSKK